MWTWFKSFWKQDKQFRWLIYFIWIVAAFFILFIKNIDASVALGIAFGASIFYILFAYIFRNNP
jgi:hypothetical protein